MFQVVIVTVASSFGSVTLVLSGALCYIWYTRKRMYSSKESGLPKSISTQHVRMRDMPKRHNDYESQPLQRIEAESQTKYVCLFVSYIFRVTGCSTDMCSRLKEYLLQRRENLSRSLCMKKRCKPCLSLIVVHDFFL